jgi:hypothetical protein
MISRQVGHFFFEPKGYDAINQASHDYKERVKVGYNLQRKMVLLTIWAFSPALLYIDPTLLGFVPVAHDAPSFVHNLSLLWLVLGLAALLFRTVQLFFVRDVQTGIVWFTKILTDPFHDLVLYYRAPWQVMRGELFEEHA